MPTTIEKIKEEFVSTFGYNGPESSCDSIGRSAGCDDCSANIKLREEHKQFLISALTRVREEALAECKEKYEKPL